MILGVCADKGSPGATTLATALGIVWQGERVVLEADPWGGDLVFWARTPAGELLGSEPSVLSLAAAARTGPPPGGLPAFGQATGWGVDVVAGAPAVHAYAPMRGLWPVVAEQAAGWAGTAVTDLGRWSLDGPVTPLVVSATGVVVLTRVTVEALYRLRERVGDLKQVTGSPVLGPGSVAVVVVAARRDAKDAVAQVRAALSAAGTPVGVLGVFAEDPRSAAELRTGVVSKWLLGGDLLSSAADLVDAAAWYWPKLTAAAVAPAPGEGPGPAQHADVRHPRGVGAEPDPGAGPGVGPWPGRARPSGSRP